MNGPLSGKKELLNPPPHLPLLYLISNRHAFPPNPDARNTAEAQLTAIHLAAQAGCQLIQIREKDLPPRAMTNFTRQAIAAARPHGAKVLVNDRLDVALAAGADGVHLRVSSLPVAEVRAAVTDKGLKDFLIGVSTHSLAEAAAAEAGGADFIVCGPVYETLSKQAYGAPLGLARFAEICRAVSIPVLALGGINTANFHEPLQHGAAGIAAISLFSTIASLESNIQTLRQSPLRY
jgi:thiamine-phosphate pyrophosphorylase